MIWLKVILILLKKAFVHKEYHICRKKKMIVIVCLDRKCGSVAAATLFILFMQAAARIKYKNSEMCNNGTIW